MLECLRDFLTANQIAFASLFNSRLTVEHFSSCSPMTSTCAATGCPRRKSCWRSNNFLLERAGAGARTV